MIKLFTKISEKYSEKFYASLVLVDHILDSIKLNESPDGKVN